MPVDTKRLPVPESAIPLSSFKVKNDESQREKLMFSGDKCRLDGRKFTEFRSPFCKTSVVSQAKGSAYIELKNTKVICSVYGPREIGKKEVFTMQGQLKCKCKFATFSRTERLGHQPGKLDEQLSILVEEALLPAVMLHSFPKSQMEVFVYVLEDDGGALSAAISAGSLALADAGIEMYDIVVGVSMLMTENVNIIDPTRDEELSKGKGSVLTIALLPALHQVSSVHHRGQVSYSTVGQGMKQCVDAAHVLSSVYRACLRGKEQNVKKTEQL